MSDLFGPVAPDRAMTPEERRKLRKAPVRRGYAALPGLRPIGRDVWNLRPSCDPPIREGLSQV